MAGRSRFDPLLVGALPDLWRFAHRLERDAVRAEDLLQEAVARALAHADALRDAAAFRGWMFQIVFRTFQHRRDAAAERRETPDDNVIHLAHAFGNPERTALDAALGRRVQRALDALPEASRDVITLIDGAGLTLAEAAAALDAPLGTVAYRLARARTALRADLHDVALDHGVIR